MPTEPSKYAENQIESATRDNYSLMAEFATDVMPRIAAAALVHPEFVPVNNVLISLYAAWGAADSVVANAAAGQESATFAFESKMTSLTRKPDPETNSPLDAWDIIIGGAVAYGGTIYRDLLPNGRETLTAGTYHQRLEALKDLGTRLAAQVAKPALVTLGGTVTDFYDEAKALRDFQTARKTALDNGRIDLEAMRKLLAAEIYAMIGIGMGVWKSQPALLDSLFDVEMLRNPAQFIPAAPADTVWTPGTRTLSTTALPAGATRLEAWREGPGGMPERLIVGERGALSVVIPANITFDPGDLYQLWLQASNSKGPSPAGPKQNWVAV